MNDPCPYCAGEVDLVNGATIYPHRPDLASKPFYRCAPCKAHVGCHPGTITPLGRLANLELRKAKVAAHAAFDPLWKSGRMTRGAAYRLLRLELCIPKSECHIGMFDEELCRKTVVVANKITVGAAS